MEELYIPASLGKLYGIFQAPSASAPLIILSHVFNGCHLGNSFQPMDLPLSVWIFAEVESDPKVMEN